MLPSVWASGGCFKFFSSFCPHTVPRSPIPLPVSWQANTHGTRPMCLGVHPSLFLSLRVMAHCFVELPPHMALDVSIWARDTLILSDYCSSCTAPVGISGMAGPIPQSSVLWHLAEQSHHFGDGCAALGVTRPLQSSARLPQWVLVTCSGQRVCGVLKAAMGSTMPARAAPSTPAASRLTMLGSHGQGDWSATHFTCWDEEKAWNRVKVWPFCLFWKENSLAYLGKKHLGTSRKIVV